jgi:hypothetical protein
MSSDKHPPDQQDQPQPEQPDKPAAGKGEAERKFADRVYRSPAAIAGGVMLLALGAWLGLDAVIRGDGRVKVMALSGLLLAVPLVIAFTMRPAVFANDDRLRVRNPFRTISLPWASVDSIRAGYSSEVFAGERKYQMWAIPVSLRARKKEQRHQDRAAVASDRGRRPRGMPFGVGLGGGGDERVGRASRPAADQAIVELRELAETNAKRPTAQGSPEVRWAFEIIAPAVVGAIAVTILLALG